MSETVRVYRIETQNKTGVYNCLFDAPFDRARHPLPGDDSLLAPQWADLIHHPEYGRHEFHFGFANPEQMRSWFYRDDWLHEMQEAGLKLSVYEVPADLTRIGHTQAVFLMKAATLIERLDLTNFATAEEGFFS